MIPIQKNWRLTLASAAAVALLAACGGGGEATSSAASANAPLAAPQATAVPMAAARSSQGASETAPVADASGTTAATVATPTTTRTGVYLVEMADLPAAVYDGRIGGYAATKVAQGQKLNPNSPDVSRYMNRLAAKHDAAMGSVGASKKLYSYGYAFNGFAAVLSEEQAAQLASSKEVVNVTKDEARAMDSSTTPAFLGLSGNSGFWASTGAKGENVIIGMVDSGIWPESLSFSDMVDANGAPTALGTVAYSRPPERWHGRCVKGLTDADKWSAGTCNRKLIGARFYHSGWDNNGYALAASEYKFSARDAEGHGTHTASTAGGNSGVVLNGPTAALGVASGMAPRARIAAYKVCWAATAQVTGGCFGSDSVAAIDQAVADGVDVINFSISGSQTTSRDPVEIAFMNAAAAGVFVAASAGNSGPTLQTVAHPSPWLTTVAAGTHNRKAVGQLTLGNSAMYSGISLAAQAVSGSFIDSVDAAMAGANATSAALCFSTGWNNGTPVLDPAKVSGKIVLCNRGTNDRVDKSKAVAQAGGIGMVLVNTSANTTVADFHSVPTVHVDYGTSGATYNALHTYSHAGGGTATIAKGTLDFSTPAPFIASFSSRGPTLAANGGNLIKPDITAPGADIVAAVSPPGNSGRKFDLYSGTSMSSPHIAGIAALFKQAHPEWSPMMIKSAMMTTASDLLGASSTTTSGIWAQGAGHVQPKKALDPGLVFDSNYEQWFGFLCGTDLPTVFCSNPAMNPLNKVIAVVDPTNLNTPSVSITQLPGSQTITRRVTNVSNASSTYNFTTPAGMANITVAASPQQFTLAPGASQDLQITFTAGAGAVIGTRVAGQLSWTDGMHVVRIPAIVRPVQFGAPAEANGNYSVKFGYTGAFSASMDGLVAAVVKTGTVQSRNGGCTALTCADIDMGSMTGKTLARYQMFDGGALVSGTDIDLEAWCGDPKVAGSTKLTSSTGDTAAEVMSITAAQCTTKNVFVRVIGYSVPNTTANFSLYTWTLDGANKANAGMSAPASAVSGTVGNITFTPVGLAAGTKYMGAVTYTGPSSPPTTVVRIDTP